MGERLAIARSFCAARWRLDFRSPAALARWQAAQLRRFLATTLPRAPYYAGLEGASLEQLPIVDKSTFLARFADLNTRGITLERATAVALAAERSRDFTPRLDGLSVGLSSGTSGSRGVFLVSDEERAAWAGTMLARMLPPALLRQVVSPWRPPLRISLVLRANSNLYRTLDGGRVRFAFHDLLEPPERIAAAAAAHAPQVLVAPSSVLRGLADLRLAGRLQLAPQQVIAVAEVLEPDDAAAIERAFGVVAQQIYQCTEGFLAYSCERGSLHLNEAFVHVEREWLDAERTRFRPLITDFTRRTQLIVRYRLDDVLRIAPPCPCGRAETTLAAIEGRADEVLWLPAGDGQGPVAVYPDALRRSMLMVGEQLTDYTVEQRRTRLEIGFASEARPKVERRIGEELTTLWQRLGVTAPELRFGPLRAPELGAKRRRIRCLERPEAAT